MALGFDGPVGAMPQETVGQERGACLAPHVEDAVLVHHAQICSFGPRRAPYSPRQLGVE